MITVIFHSDNAAFKFDQKEVRDQLIDKKTEYTPDEIVKLNIISTDGDETILSSDDHNYFGFVVLDLISARPEIGKNEISGHQKLKYRWQQLRDDDHCQPLNEHLLIIVIFGRTSLATGEKI